MEPTVYLVLLNWNGKEDTLECLASLQKVGYPRFWTLLVDNGSTDGSVETIRASYPNIPIFESRANLGFAEGNNIGIRWALQKGADWILLLNNDTIVAPDFLERFLEAAQKKPQAKILGAKIYRYDEPKCIDHLGGFWDPVTAEFASPVKGQRDDDVSFETMEKVDYVCGAALMMHRSVPETVGLLESRFFLFWEETDLCFRAKRAGFESWTAPKAKVWHKVSSSFIGGKPHMHYFWWRSRLLWLERNCSFKERRKLHRQVVLPELWKTLRHYLFRSLQNGLTRLTLRTPTPARQQKALRYKAGLLGACHYLFRRFGNCPKNLSRKL